MEAKDVKKATVEILAELLSEGKNIVCMDADLGTATALLEFGRLYPHRYFETGIAEQNLIGTAAGLAEAGCIPFAGSFACFMTQRGGDQMVNAVGYNEYNVKLLGVYAGLSSEKNGGTHISVEDMAIARGIPGFTVIAPGDVPELKGAIRAAAETEGPFYIRIPRGPLETFNQENYRFIIGRGTLLREGTDIAIITTGYSAWDAKLAADRLCAEGYSICHLHLPTIKPIDQEAIINAARVCKEVVTVEDHSIYGGLGSAVCEVLAENYPKKVTRLGLQDLFGKTAKLKWLKHEYKIDEDAIYEKCKEIINK